MAFLVLCQGVKFAPYFVDQDPIGVLVHPLSLRHLQELLHQLPPQLLKCRAFAHGAQVPPLVKGLESSASIQTEGPGVGKTCPDGPDIVDSSTSHLAFVTDDLGWAKLLGQGFPE